MLAVRNDVIMLEICKRRLIEMGQLGQFNKIKEKNKKARSTSHDLKVLSFLLKWE
jgi:hypothetical protein